MKEFIEYLVKELVTKPEDVVVSIENIDNVTVYRVHVATQDMGVLIGKEGNTIKSIRNLVKAKAILDNVHVKVEIEEVPQDQSVENAEN
jgi:uncharacterized protein